MFESTTTTPVYVNYDLQAVLFMLYYSCTIYYSFFSYTYIYNVSLINYPLWFTIIHSLSLIIIHYQSLSIIHYIAHYPLSSSSIVLFMLYYSCIIYHSFFFLSLYPYILIVYHSSIIHYHSFIVTHHHSLSIIHYRPTAKKRRFSSH